MFDNIFRGKVFIFLLIGLSLVLLISSVILFSKKNALNQQLEQTKQMVLKVNEEKQRIEAEKEKITKENEKLKADTLVYIELNNNLQKEKENLQNRLKEAQKIIETKEDGLERLKLNLEKLNKKIAKESGRQNEELMKQKKELEDKVSSLETTLQKERALYHYNLAVSYTKAKLYDEAIKVFEKSLIFDIKLSNLFMSNLEPEEGPFGDKVI